MTSTPFRPKLRPNKDENHSSSKRQRLSSSAQALSQKKRTPANEVAQDEEKALMDDLMAGLDASMFDNLGSSPVRPKSNKTSQASPVNSQSRMQSQRKHVEVKIEPLSPKKRLNNSPKKKRSSNHSPTKSKNAFAPTIVRTQLKPPMKDRIRKSEPTGPQILLEQGIKDEHREPSTIPQAKAEPEPEPEIQAKLELEDEDLYQFDFDLNDLSALDDDLLEPPKPKIRYPIPNPDRPPPPPGYIQTPWVRCIVNFTSTGLCFSDGVIPPMGEIVNGGGEGTSFGKTLVVTFTDDESKRVIHLKDQWSNLNIKKNDIINIISPNLTSRDSRNPAVVTLKDPATFLIHHPDLMLTMTSIANAMPCPRKPILQTLIKAPGPPTKPILYGNLLHSLLQGALAKQSFDAVSTFDRIDIELKKEQTRMDIWSAGMGTMDVREELGARAGRGFEVFGDKWVGNEPKTQGELHTAPGENPALLAINGLHEVEEDIWSPKWGLKGKVDASVQAKITHDPTKTQEAEEHIAPLEIKTGRSVGVMAHRAQTMLYTLLMEDRYGVPVPAGLLYYSQSDTILRVEAKQNEIRALIIARNELADWLSKKRRVPKEKPPTTDNLVNKVEDVEEAFLPSTIDHSRECRSCYAVDSCMLYRKINDNIHSDPEDPIAELYQEKTGHMTEKDTEFFKKWDTLLTVEEQDIGRHRSQLWTMTAKEREKTGRCFGDMIISSYSNDIGKSLAKIHRHAYTFVRAPHAGTQVANISLLSGHIAKGDPVSLSIEPDLLCLSRGFVLDLTAESVTIGVTYVIDVEALLKRTGRSHALSEGVEAKVVFRIDKDEMASGMMRMRNNLASLFYSKNGDEERRRLIVDLDKPEYENSWRLASREWKELPKTLNEDQTKAINKVLTARDYSLILGMPGTGKTTTISELIKILVKRGKSVLLTSYTHSAVDTILMKLLNIEFGILRLGNIDKVHPDVQHLTLEAMEESTNMEQLEKRLMNPPVVAATCLAIDYPLFFKRKFDYCIVDEASQITLPTCLGPLRMADKFVLVGDHFQLPPIVRHSEARRGGLDISLFKLLSLAHPQSVSDLSMQYRMNEDIMLLSNKLVYEGKLKCGNEEVAKRGLVLKNRIPCREMLDCTESHNNLKKDCWIQELLEESAKCIFVDTDGLPAPDSRVGDLVQNEVEARLVQQLATALTTSGLHQEDLAIITPYRQQIKLLSSLLKPLPRVEILTADKSQGRDKDCILISLVRSNEDGNIGDLLKDWRRINVSFTRAKKKLIIFGSAKTLSRDSLLRDFLELMNNRKWIKRLQKGDDHIHQNRNIQRLSTTNIISKVENAGNQDTKLVGLDQKKEEDLDEDTESNMKRGESGRKVVRGNSGILIKGAFGKEILVSFTPLQSSPGLCLTKSDFYDCYIGNGVILALPFVPEETNVHQLRK
ncbi:uncharacterized protein L201_005679 [Kwoniella dendrophila CBS 6074]|uniref:DNA replication ATP-dependent helicase/nuclease DNA2 n=1 Tax=Kwoniella dendrophila CBS 6074 TaxID=1295534 RepID=A0AAX4JZP1_9TREE